jgi:hypothetical protein
MSKLLIDHETREIRLCALCEGGIHIWTRTSIFITVQSAWTPGRQSSGRLPWKPVSSFFDILNTYWRLAVYKNFQCLKSGGNSPGFHVEVFWFVAPEDLDLKPYRRESLKTRKTQGAVRSLWLTDAVSTTLSSASCVIRVWVLKSAGGHDKARGGINWVWIGSSGGSCEHNNNDDDDDDDNNNNNNNHNDVPVL